MLAVSIVTYNVSDEELRKVLLTLLKCEEICRIDIIDNSRNQSTELIVDSFSNQKINYIPSDNIGYGAANNISIKKSLELGNVDFHLVMNSDIVFEPKVITELIKIMSSDPSIGLTIPMVTDINGREESSYHPLPSPMDLISRRFLPQKWVKKRLARFNILVEGKSAPIEAPYIYGCFMMLSCEALKNVGLFDERFFMYPEDIDLSRRINQKYKTLVIPTVSIVHYHRKESSKSLKMLWIHIYNIIKYFNKWGWIKSNKQKNC